MRGQQANIFFLAQDRQRFGCIFRGDDGLVEQLVNLASGICVQGTVTANNTAIGRNGITHVRFFISIEQCIVAGQAAGVGVLDNDDSGRAEALH